MMWRRTGSEVLTSGQYSVVWESHDHLSSYQLWHGDELIHLVTTGNTHEQREDAKHECFDKAREHAGID